jgi:CBS domain-containing protein
MTLSDILEHKGSNVHTIGPAASLDDVVDQLVQYNVGSLVVCESSSRGTDIRVIGIITERDILRAQAAHRAPLDQITVADAMSRELITALPTDQLDTAMRLMTHHRVRHLPVMDDTGRLFGIISIGDVVKAQHDELLIANHYMSRELADRDGYWW